jgi:hypothetical protein
MFMYRQQLRFLILLMYSLPYILYMFSPSCMWSAALNKPGSVITQGTWAGGGGMTTSRPTAEFWMISGRNSLLGKRKKIAKFLMRTFTYLPLCCGVSANEYSCAHHVTWSPNKHWRSTSIFNLWSVLTSRWGRGQSKIIWGTAKNTR